MLLGYESIITIILGIAGVLVVLWAQMKITGMYQKCKKISTRGALSGQEIARKILDENGLKDIYVVETRGELSDHYDPRRKVVRLSHEIFHGSSVASVAIAAHEVGHAIQDKEGYAFMRFRSALVPFVNFITYIGYFVLLISIFGGMTGYLKVSILLILATLLFQLITLPVEFNASKRAEENLLKLSLVTKQESNDTHQMLSSAALTYVASLISTVLSLLRLIIMLDRNRD